MNFAFESGFRVNFRSVLRNIQELAVDGVAVGVGAIADVARQSDHSLRDNTLPLEIWGRLRRGITPEINAISSLILAASVVLLVVWYHLRTRSERQ